MNSAHSLSFVKASAPEVSRRWMSLRWTRCRSGWLDFGTKDSMQRSKVSKWLRWVSMETEEAWWSETAALALSMSRMAREF